MSAVFLGLSRFTLYLKLYYELYGAAEKIGAALLMPQEELHEPASHIPDQGSLTFKDLMLKHHQDTCTLNVSLDAGTKVFVTSENNWTQKQLVALLKRYEKPYKGWLLLGDMSLYDYDIYELRQSISLIDRSLIMECTIEDYLRLSAPTATVADIRSVLENVELLNTIEHFEHVLKTRLSALGTPLQPLELLLLKLAGAMLSQPKVLLINQHFDAIPHALRGRLLTLIARQPFSVLYFSNVVQPQYLDGTLTLDEHAVLHYHSLAVEEGGDE